MKHRINETQINSADIKAIFKDASGLRDKPGILDRFKKLKKEKISINDLQQSWKDKGFPDDTEDIKSILLDYGFSNKEIDKVFAEVFGNDYADQKYNDPKASKAIQDIADYIKGNGLTDEVNKYLTMAYSEELGTTEKKPGFFKRMFGKKAVAEDVGKIFTEIVKEERTDRLQLISELERTQLGRSRK